MAKICRKSTTEKGARADRAGSDCGAEERADSGGDGHGERAPEGDAERSGGNGRASGMGGEGSHHGEETEGRGGDEGNQGGGRGEGRDQQGHGGSGGEAGGRGEGGLNGAGGERIGDAEFVARMSAEGIVRHELLGDLFGERGVESAGDIDVGQFAMLAGVIGGEFGAFHFEFSLFGVGLGVDGDVLAGGHGHGAGDQAGDSRDHDIGVGGVGGGNAQDEAGGREDAVIGAENGGAEPADASDAVLFDLSAAHSPIHEHVMRHRRGAVGGRSAGREGGDNMKTNSHKTAPTNGQSSEIQKYGTVIERPLSLEHKVRLAMANGLNQILADTMTLRDLYKKHHWQVSGATFYQLHLLFDKHFGEQAELVDTIAERVQTLGGVAIAMAPDVAETTRIARAPRGREDAPMQLFRLMQAHELIIAESRELAKAAIADGDDGTNDLLVSDVIRGNELQVWFISEQMAGAGIADNDEQSARPLVEAHA